MTTQISWIIADASGNILRSGNSPTIEEAALQAGAGETAFTLSGYKALFDEREYTINLTTGALTTTAAHPSGAGGSGDVGGSEATIE
jgi:hypothetical protein